MQSPDAPAEIGCSSAVDIDQLRLENSQLRGLVVDLSKLVLVNVASQKTKLVQTIAPTPAYAQRSR